MNFEDVFEGSRYLIDYLDPEYPCKCRCHDNPNFKCKVPCCYDRSYHGVATCIEKNKENELIKFEVGPNSGFLLIYAEDVLDKLQE